MPVLLSNEDVEQLLDVETSVRALESAVREWAHGDAAAIPRHNFFAPAGREGEVFQFGIMSGGSKNDQLYCLRILDDILYYQREGDTLTREKYCIEPGTYCGLLLLFSTANGELLGIMPDGVVQHMRVAGETAVGVDILANSDASTIGMLGSGGMARSFAEAISVVRDIRSIKVFSPTREHREAYARDLSEKLGIGVQSVNGPREAIQGTDIVCLCTDSLRPVMSAEWLEPGQLVACVGGGGGSLDVGGDLSRFQGSFVISTDDLASVEDRGGGYMIGYSYYAGQSQDFEAIPQEAWWSAPEGRNKGMTRLLDVMTGAAAGRSRREDILYLFGGGYTSVGFSALAGHVYRAAKEKGLGQQLPLDWFVQKVRD